MGPCLHGIAHALGDLIVMIVTGAMTLAFLARGRKIRQLEQEREHLGQALDACTAELIRLARGKDVQ